TNSLNIMAAAATKIPNWDQPDHQRPPTRICSNDIESVMGDVDWFGLRSLFLSEDGWTPFSVTNTSPDVPDFTLHFSHQLSVVGAADDGIRMLPAQAVLKNRQRSPVQRFCGFQFLLGLVQHG